jgi:hypothetical protein
MIWYMTAPSERMGGQGATARSFNWELQRHCLNVAMAAPSWRGEWWRPPLASPLLRPKWSVVLCEPARRSATTESTSGNSSQSNQSVVLGNGSTAPRNLPHHPTTTLYNYRLSSPFSPRWSQGASVRFWDTHFPQQKRKGPYGPSYSRRILRIRVPNGSLRYGLVLSAILWSAKAGHHPVVQGEW